MSEEAPSSLEAKWRFSTAEVAEKLSAKFLSTRKAECRFSEPLEGKRTSRASSDSGSA